MARSSLFASLLRLSEAGRAASESGTDACEVLAARDTYRNSDEGLSRRQFLGAAAISAAAASTVGQLVLPKRAEAAKPKSQPSIAIVGAGISGMTAAMHLRDKGFNNVTVYEANTRIGGRTFTRSGDGFFEAGQWAEWGGELIDTDHKTVLALAKRYGVNTIDLAAIAPSGSDDTLYFKGGYYPWSAMVADWISSKLERVIKAQAAILPAGPYPYTASWSPAARAISGTNIGTWIDTYVPGGRGSKLGGFIDAAYAIEFGENVDRQSVINLLALLGSAPRPRNPAFWIYGKSDERFKLVGGNQQISVAQAAELGSSNIALGYRLTSASRLGDGRANLQFSVGSSSQTVVADRVIMAIPLGIMKSIKASGGFAGAGFDPLMSASIDALGFGADNKLQLQISDRFWTMPGQWGNTTGESYADTGYQEAWHVTPGQPGTTGIINNYTGGDVSRSLNPAKPFSDTTGTGGAFVTSAAQTFLSQIEPVFPGMTARWTGKAQLSAWHVNPNSLGAYSYYRPGYCEQFCTAEAIPARPFHFAGEHTSQDYQGYIEGAAVEGKRAAQELVADFT